MTINICLLSWTRIQMFKLSIRTRKYFIVTKNISLFTDMYCWKVSKAKSFKSTIKYNTVQYSTIFWAKNCSGKFQYL